MSPDDPSVERAHVVNPLATPPLAQRILVIRLGALGDVVRTRFAFAGLRQLYPDAEIHWLVEDRAADGLAGIRGLDRIVEIQRNELRLGRPLRLARELMERARELREFRYDLVIDFHGILKSSLLGWASGAPIRVGFGRAHAREGSALFLTHRAKLDRAHISRFERNAALVRYLGGAVSNQVPPLALDPAESGAPNGQAFGVVHPGTSVSTLYKRWHAERFAEVCARLYEERAVRFLVTWGGVPGEKEAAQEVVERAGVAAELAPPTHSVADLLALMRGARLFIGSDSGPMHIASLVGVPVVAVFGPTDPLENAPFPGVSQRIVRQDVGCNPCREGCPSRACMAAVSSAAVARAALEVL